MSKGTYKLVCTSSSTMITFMKKKKKGHCAICGIHGRVTREHVPPKSLFPRPQTNPIIVPTCEKCNGGSSEVDQRFATLMKLNRPTLQDDADARESVMRTLRNNRKLYSEILDSITFFPIQSSSGIYTGKTGGLIKNISSDGFDELIEKIVRCLYFHHNQQILPSNSRVELFFDNLLLKNNKNNIGLRQETLNISNLLAVGQINDPDSFFYRWGICEDSPHNSLWILYFKTICYTAMVRQQE